MSKDDPLIEILLRDAHRFDVFQAVRVLERWAARHGRKPVGDDAQPLEEAVRFKSAVTTAFPPTAIRQLRAAAKPTPNPRRTTVAPEGRSPRRRPRPAWPIARNRRRT